MRYRPVLILVAVLSMVGLVGVLGIAWARHQPPSAAPTHQALPQPSSASPSVSESPDDTPTEPASGNGTPSASGTPSRSATPSRTTVAPPSRTVTASAPGVPAALLGKDVEVIPTSRRVVALTFDAGANGDGLSSILSTLAAQQVPGTFFLTGDFATGDPAAVRAITAAGHRLGNHSATHPSFPDLSDTGIRDELTRAQAAIRAAGGSDPRPLFRFPFGDRDARTIATVNAAGYLPVRWTVDTLGWQGNGRGITVQNIVDRVLAAARPGAIVLMHIGSNPTDHSTLDADALPAMITQLRALGYSFVTLDALLASG